MNSVIAHVLIPLCLLGQTTVRTIQGEKPTGEVKGRVVDGLGRPLEGVHVMISSKRKGDDGKVQSEARTDHDGRYRALIDDNSYHESVDVEFKKPGYMEAALVFADGPPEERTLRRTMEGTGRGSSGDPEHKDLAEGSLWYAHLATGDQLVQEMREILATYEWEYEDQQVVPYLFNHHEKFRDAFRNLVRDPHVGSSARYWLDLQGDPRDAELFPDGRKLAPDLDIQRADLMEAIRETTRQLNWFSEKPEPRVNFDIIAFAPDLNSVFIQCGINRVAMTGITWRFVYRKVEGQWKLVSKEEHGRS